MIKINLLPHLSRKKAAVNRRAQLAGLGAVVVLLALMYAWWTMASEARSLRAEIAVTQQELKRYDEIAKKVAKFEADKKRLEEKIKTIDRLIASQTGPVRLMDQISRQLPNEVWLTGLREAGGRVTLQGFAFTDFAIAEYMTRLKRDGGLFSEVELSFSERTEVQKVPVKRFELTLRVKT
ncbi:MAG: PilN domain-containing protein [candidate division NC10 bacterium]|nr:PilN domain-containing protein [candidate division NC10 bacterium]